MSAEVNQAMINIMVIDTVIWKRFSLSNCLYMTWIPVLEMSKIIGKGYMTLASFVLSTVTHNCKNMDVETAGPPFTNMV